jgi:uncharacterized membrane protein YdjX (TVP38/TMEM64 family)
MTTESSPPRGLRWLALLAVVVILALAVIWWSSDLGPMEVIEWLRNAGWVGIVGFVVVYAVITCAVLPSILLSLATGYVYGPVVAFFLVWLCNAFSGTLAFLIGRTLVRESLVQRWGASPRWRALSAALDRDGLRVVALLRLTPMLPYALASYFLSVMPIRLGQYVLGTLIGTAPVIAVIVYTGSLAANLQELLRKPSGGQTIWLQLAAVLMTVVCLTWLIRWATRSLRATMESDEQPDG